MAKVASRANAEAHRTGRIIFTISESEFLLNLYNSNDPVAKPEIPGVDTAPDDVEPRTAMTDR